MDNLTLEGEEYAWVEVPMGAAKMDKEGHPYAGEYKNGRNTIDLVVPSTASDMRDTQLHELLHVCAYRSGALSKVTLRNAETFISLVTPWLLALLRENPEWTQSLLEGV